MKIIPRDQERAALAALIDGRKAKAQIARETGLHPNTITKMKNAVEAARSGCLDLRPYNLDNVPWYVLRRRYSIEVEGKKYVFRDKDLFDRDLYAADRGGTWAHPGDRARQRPPRT